MLETIFGNEVRDTCHSENISLSVREKNGIVYKGIDG